MLSRCVSIRGLVLLAAGALSSANSWAVTFGDTLAGPSTYVAPCIDGVVVSLPLTVAVPSRIFVTGTAEVESFSAVYTGGAIKVWLRDAADTTTLAASPYAYSASLTASTAIVSWSTSALLLAGNTGMGTAYSAPPGNYLLKLVINPSGGCSGVGPYAYFPTLTYILLSSALDRIFADGFNAMILDRSETTLVA